VDLYQKRTWTCIREGHGFLSGRTLTLSENDLGFDQRITWTFIKERTELVSENLVLYQGTWACIREVLVSNLDQIIAIVVAIFVVLHIQIFT